MAKGNVTAVIDADSSRLVAELRKTQGQMTTFMRNTNKQMTSFQKDMKSSAKMTNAFASQLAVLGTAAGGMALFGVLKTAVSSMADFEKAMSGVKAVSNANEKQTAALRDKFLELGRTTKFTATEAANLGKELAKLGFNTTEILNASAAVLDLAAATDTDLAKSAEIAGITLRQFNLNATEMGRVTDVMAKSFSSSALDIDKFSEAMKYAGPVAQSVGLTIEETTAMIAALADAGISGSMAGTSLRRIFLEMASSGKKGAEAFHEVTKAGITLAGAEDEVGKTAVTALTVLAAQPTKLRELTDAFKGASGAAGDMARTMQDNLLGDVTLLESAIDGLFQKTSMFNDAMRTAVQESTRFINSISGVGNESESWFTSLSRLGAVFGPITGQIAAYNKGVYELIGLTQEVNEETQKAVDFNWQRFGALLEEGKALAETKRQAEAQAEADRIAAEQKEAHTKALAAFRQEMNMIRVEWDTLDTSIKMNEESVLSWFETYRQGLTSLESLGTGLNDITLPEESADQNEDAYNNVMQRMEAENALADTVVNSASMIGAALAQEGDERKKAVREALKANAAMIISELIKKAVTTAKDPITGIILGGIAAAGGSFLINKIPALAEGGIVDSPTLALIGEAGPEAVVPLSGNNDYMGGGTVNIYAPNVMGTTNDLARSLDQVFKNYTRSGRKLNFL